MAKSLVECAYMKAAEVEEYPEEVEPSEELEPDEEENEEIEEVDESKTPVQPSLKEAKAIDYDLSDFAKKKDVPVLKELLTGGVGSLKAAADNLELAQKKMLALEPGKLSPELEDKLSQFAMSVVDLKKQVIQAMQNMNAALKSVGSGISESKLNEEADDGDFADILPFLQGATVKGGAIIVSGKNKDDAVSKISSAFKQAKSKNKSADTSFAWKHVGGEPYVIELRPA